MEEKKQLGFAVLKKKDEKRLKEICSMGGKAAVNRHRWSSEEASYFGKLGGAISRRKKRAEQQ